ncbi:MAG: phospholipid carrier-dependent glycosyltransferase [Chloroflexota bacterium]|nr:MAG: phospholipid carrier-dependent glycosyltransferase [Chloroflexota bacterium]
MANKFLPIILILLLAFALRTHRLTEIPPGLTHDEANHGRDSINILDGVLLFYFPLNYGSEPFYNYVVAGSMAMFGENLYALRYVNVVFGLLTVAATYLWANWAFGRRVAIVAAGLIAVSFWPLATSRQALRAGMLPFIATAGVIFFWRIYHWANDAAAGWASKWGRGQWWALIGFVVSVAATLHTYLAARVLWLIYPIFLAYLALFQRPIARRIWRPVVGGLLAIFLLIVPMFAYVQAHPEAETRLQMLDGPLQSLQDGDLLPIVKNAWLAFLALLWPGYGDHFLAYNMPGRPVLSIVTAALFLVGLGLALWRWRRPAYAFLLIWFGVGILPSLITGPEANTTRNLGALPAVFLLPAVGFVGLAELALRRWGQPARRLAIGAAFAWLLLVLFVSADDYFNRWAESPDVRAAYQQNLTQAVDYLKGLGTEEATVLSSVYPGAAHDPSIARVLLPDGQYDLRWIDARYGLLFPGGGSAQLIVPSSTPLHAILSGYVKEVDSVILRQDDLDPSFTHYRLLNGDWLSADPIDFGGAVELLDARWREEAVTTGATAELVTIWRVSDAAKVGPAVPPAFETDVVLFTHLLDPAGGIVAQRDSLEAPSWDWQAGDIFIQIHPLVIPADAAPGSYTAVVGVYDRASGARLPVIDGDGHFVDNHASVVPLNVNE